MWTRARLPFVMFLILLIGAPATVAPGAPLDRPVRMALLLSGPGRGDLSWNFMHWLGAQRARELGLAIEPRIVVSTPTAALSDMTLLVQSRAFDLIYVASFSTYGTATKELANRFPDQNFAISDIRPDFRGDDPGDRAVLGLLFQQEQPSAMAGALATGLAVYYNLPRVGIVLGREIPVLHEFEMGYKWGVDWAIQWLERNNPELLTGKTFYRTPRPQRVLYTYTGTFSDPAKGREATEAQVRQGAGVIFAVAGATGLGVLNFIDDRHREANIPVGQPPFAIGVDTVQEWISPHVIGSALKRADEAVLIAVRSVREGRFREMVAQQKFIWLNFRNKGTWFSDPDTVREWVRRAVEIKELEPSRAEAVLANYTRLRRAQPQWIWSMLNQLRQQIINGTVRIPRPFGEPDKWPMDQLRARYG
jgi:basic membrane protein A